MIVIYDSETSWEEKTSDECDLGSHTTIVRTIFPNILINFILTILL